MFNQNMTLGDGLVDSLQKEYDSYPGFPSAKFINGGQNKHSNSDMVAGAKIQISSLKPDYTILVTGLSSEVMNDSLYDLNFISRLCPFERIGYATDATASLFLKNYTSSIAEIQQETTSIGGKFIVLFLGAKMRKSELIKKLGLCSFLSDRLPKIEISTDSIIQELTNNKFKLIYSSFFSKIILENGQINKYGDFSPAANKKLAKQISFWLFPELAND